MTPVVEMEMDGDVDMGVGRDMVVRRRVRSATGYQSIVRSTVVRRGGGGREGERCMYSGKKMMGRREEGGRREGREGRGGG